jgi:glycosyltransferase involved in cell wall biosynthesis
MLPLIQEVPGLRKAFSERQDIVFLGGFAHPPNADAVLFFCSDILPLVRTRLPGVRFIVVGSNPPPSILQLASSDIEIRGFVENLDEIFDHCRLSVAPLRYGAGMKGKVVTSLSYGVPCITTSIGSEGMGLVDGSTITIRDDAASIADAVVELYCSEERWNEISKGGVEFAKQTFTPEVVEKGIVKMMEELGVGIAG